MDLGRMNDVANRSFMTRDPREGRLMLRYVGLVDENGMVDELAKILERLEDVLRLLRTRARYLARRERLGLRVGEIVVELFLQRRKLDVVVLDDLRGKVVEDVLLETAEEEGEDLLVERFEGERTRLLLLR